MLVGAEVGTQSTASGGADFSARLERRADALHGEPSVAAMLPLRECNKLVMSFARRAPATGDRAGVPRRCEL
ncbi:hypothetical protein [Bradyrhizobium sp. BWA-3-5]|uniref:hypothetical protein n=1 Tax=Bradyrhizobium sp. BWA-3-5 TaxID=3080013 RepID=UPI00293EFC0F|nr:hypothetical protein [Bradyrhizobium sp. BWA-3-5]WOH63925.1 hypothetical protein RX331_25175 [Bradyrhizobium sp. BWA-3-5]